MTDIPEDVMEAAYQVIARHRALDGSELKRGGAMATFIARAIHAERERTAARLDRVEGLLKRAGEALEPFADGELHECLSDGPDDQRTSWPSMRLGDYRAARAVVAEIEETLNDRS